VAPSQIASSPFLSAFNAATWPRVSPSFTVSAGDMIVVLFGAESEACGAITLTNSGAAQTWTTRQTNNSTAGWGTVYAWTATASTGQTMTVTCTPATASGFNGVAVYVFSAATHGGVGSTNKGKSAASPGTTVPSVALTCSANSAVVSLNTDWGANSHGATRSYNTATAGTATEGTYFSNGSNYSVETWYHADAGAAGAKTIGMTTPNQTWATVTVEVLESGGAAAPSPRGFNAIPFIGGGL
jgi:hypothetical protein